MEDPLASLAPVPEPGEAALFSGAWLSQPTETGITISVIPAVALELQVVHSEKGSDRSVATPIVEGPADRILALRVEGLEPGGRYAYRLRYRPAEAFGRYRAAWIEGPQHRLNTSPPRGSRFRFAFLTDSHIVNRWSGADCGRNPRGLPRFRQNLENVRDAGVDFVVLGGDEVMTHAPRRTECLLGQERVAPDRGGIGPRHAHLRYRIFRHLYGPLAASHPIFLTLGNHDGEAGFGGAEGECGHGLDLAEVSRQARMAHLDNPFPIYGGDPNGGYYAFGWGDALFVVLDVMGHTPDTPRRADDWTLGRDQMRWLARTLRQSDHAFKLVFAHHLVGGLKGRGDCYHYARGGAYSTIGGALEAPLRGEQEEIDRLMRRYGAQVFFHGHDHLFSHTAKPTELDPGTEVHYVNGGVAAGRGAFWRRARWIKRGYGVGPDGKPNALHGPGFVQVEVRGAEELVVEYVQAEPWKPEENGKVLYRTTIPGPSRAGRATGRSAELTAEVEH